MHAVSPTLPRHFGEAELAEYTFTCSCGKVKYSVTAPRSPSVVQYDTPYSIRSAVELLVPEEAVTWAAQDDDLEATPISSAAREAPNEELFRCRHCQQYAFTYPSRFGSALIGVPAEALEATQAGAGRGVTVHRLDGRQWRAVLESALDAEAPAAQPPQPLPPMGSAASDAGASTDGTVAQGASGRGDGSAWGELSPSWDEESADPQPSVAVVTPRPTSQAQDETPPRPLPPSACVDGGGVGDSDSSDDDSGSEGGLAEGGQASGQGGPTLAEGRQTRHPPQPVPAPPAVLPAAHYLQRHASGVSALRSATAGAWLHPAPFINTAQHMDSTVPPRAISGSGLAAPLPGAARGPTPAAGGAMAPPSTSRYTSAHHSRIVHSLGRKVPRGMDDSAALGREVPHAAAAPRISPLGALAGAAGRGISPGSAGEAEEAAWAGSGGAGGATPWGPAVYDAGSMQLVEGRAVGSTSRVQPAPRPSTAARRLPMTPAVDQESSILAATRQRGVPAPSPASAPASTGSVSSKYWALAPGGGLVPADAAAATSSWSTSTSPARPHAAGSGASVASPAKWAGGDGEWVADSPAIASARSTPAPPSTVRRYHATPVGTPSSVRSSGRSGGRPSPPSSEGGGSTRIRGGVSEGLSAAGLGPTRMGAPPPQSDVGPPLRAGEKTPTRVKPGRKGDAAPPPGRKAAAEAAASTLSALVGSEATGQGGVGSGQQSSPVAGAGGGPTHPPQWPTAPARMPQPTPQKRAVGPRVVAPRRDQAAAPTPASVPASSPASASGPAGLLQAPVPGPASLPVSSSPRPGTALPTSRTAQRDKAAARAKSARGQEVAIAAARAAMEAGNAASVAAMSASGVRMPRSPHRGAQTDVDPEPKEE